MIVLFGIAGSGKGTQAEILAKKLSCPVVSTGDILRKNADNPKVKAALDAGVLLSDDITLELVGAELKKINASQQEFILDGSPRNTNQSKWLDEKIKNGELKLTAILHLNLSKEAALARLKTRARHDDTEESINKRFAFYNESVVPAMDYLKDKGYEIVEINGEQPVEAVAAEIEAALES